MDQRTPTAEEPDAGSLPASSGSGQNPCHPSAPKGGKVVALAKIFIRTLRHFWPKFNDWVNDLPDTRWQEIVTYNPRFLIWWGLLLFCLKLGSRRQLDFQLRDLEICVLDNLNRFAQTEQDSLPVNKTLSHYLSHVGSSALADLRTDCVRHLIRNKVLDPARYEGYFVIVIDGTGFLSFSKRHCSHCLAHKNGSSTYYLHPVLEAKLVHSSGLAISIGTEFIENPKECPQEVDPATLTDYEKVKQDCELKAFSRLAASLKKDFPQLPLLIGGDSLYACGTAITLCKLNGWSYTLTFKSGRTPALWKDFQGLLMLSQENRLNCILPDQTRQCFRWINDISYQDSEGREHIVNALLCEEIPSDQETQTFAWLTDQPLNSGNVRAVAAQTGRVRSKIENQGFNIQKNSGLNLEHAYSTDPDVMKAFYYLLQIAHLFLQMFEMGSLLRHLAKRYNCASPIQFLGSLKNLARWLLDSLRYFDLGSEAFQSWSGQIRIFDSS
ncbi:MAG: hypothetical protein ACYTGS_15680 [Planctomycetota bacterium]|jgi:hypothetical protein